MRTVLLTGFAPFAGHRINSSWEVVKQLHGNRLAGMKVKSLQLPCSFSQSTPVINEAIPSLRPELIICTGQAGGRSHIGIERIAVNLIDARIPDNDDLQPIDVPVIPDAPIGYWSTLPIKAIVYQLQRSGIPASVSSSAGSYVCNALFFRVMHELSHHFLPIRAGFIHLPYLPEQGEPSLPLIQMKQALSVAIQISIEQRQDIKYPGGTLY